MSRSTHASVLTQEKRPSRVHVNNNGHTVLAAVVVTHTPIPACCRRVCETDDGNAKGGGGVRPFARRCCTHTFPLNRLKIDQRLIACSRLTPFDRYVCSPQARHGPLAFVGTPSGSFAEEGEALQTTRSINQERESRWTTLRLRLLGSRPTPSCYLLAGGATRFRRAGVRGVFPFLFSFPPFVFGF